MVSKASEDFPEPDSPVTQIRALRGSRTVTFLRLCSRAPCTTSSSAAMDSSLTRGSDRTDVLFWSSFQLLAPIELDCCQRQRDGPARPVARIDIDGALRGKSCEAIVGRPGHGCRALRAGRKREVARPAAVEDEHAPAHTRAEIAPVRAGHETAQRSSNAIEQRDLSPVAIHEEPHGSWRPRDGGEIVLTGPDHFLHQSRGPADRPGTAVDCPKPAKGHGGGTGGAGRRPLEEASIANERQRPTGLEGR